MYATRTFLDTVQIQTMILQDWESCSLFESYFSLIFTKNVKCKLSLSYTSVCYLTVSLKSNCADSKVQKKHTPLCLHYFQVLHHVHYLSSQQAQLHRTQDLQVFGGFLSNHFLFLYFKKNFHLPWKQITSPFSVTASLLLILRDWLTFSYKIHLFCLLALLVTAQISGISLSTEKPLSISVHPLNSEMGIQQVTAFPITPSLLLQCRSRQRMLIPEDEGWWTSLPLMIWNRLQFLFTISSFLCDLIYSRYLTIVFTYIQSWYIHSYKYIPPKWRLSRWEMFF